MNKTYAIDFYRTQLKEATKINSLQWSECFISGGYSYHVNYPRPKVENEVRLNGYFHITPEGLCFQILLKAHYNDNCSNTSLMLANNQTKVGMKSILYFYQFYPPFTIWLIIPWKWIGLKPCQLCNSTQKFWPNSYLDHFPTIENEDILRVPINWRFPGTHSYRKYFERLSRAAKEVLYRKPFREWVLEISCGSAEVKTYAPSFSDTHWRLPSWGR